MDEPIVFTIGHSSHDLTAFLDLLRGAGITAVADVRSVPFSRRVPHFSRPALKPALDAAGIAYVHLGEALGARPADPGLYRNGVADYARIAATPAFQDGLQRVIRGTARHTVALMCAEKDPLDCHRMHLVARSLVPLGVRVRHILADGTLEEHADAERRLAERSGHTGDLFEPGTDDDGRALRR